MADYGRPSEIGRIATIILGALILLFGVIFLGGGAELAALGGSWYYILCGIVLTASGVLTIKGRLLGAWLFLLAWAGTLLWTIYEVGFDGWGWLPRLFGPTIILVLVLVSLPALRRRDTIRPTIRSAV
ncbi:glycerol dehydrogenase [Brytella acorum]|uniref:Glycerol dehydrogenase n=1 Tax=Brytella acorum TaxID=2959299 RepID=A0AA35V1D2_9PROT|nr:glycerol dehydrogenase [Brytella acorum]MDF3624016.1 glycerol dehydrogenase [Brytella acorum]CAI9120881.1 glycerol dehydrogenase [Brytella acorum]